VLSGGQFRASRQAPQGPPSDLEFPQNDGKISIRSDYGAIYDLGPGKLDDFLEVGPPSAVFIRLWYVVPPSGHVYSLNQQVFLKHWVLFQLEFGEKAPRVPSRP
jgi:hypothetical protein